MEEFYEKFDSYVHGELGGEELKAFEAALAQNPVLREDLEMYQQVDETLQHHFEHKNKTEQLKGTLSSLNKEFFQQEQEEAKVIQMKPRRNLLKWAVAAAVVISVSVFLPRFISKPAPSYANLIKMPNASFTEMGITEDQEILATAQKAFNDKNYAQVVTTLKPFVESHPENSTTNFYLALAHLETNHFEEAESLLKTLSQGASVYATEAIWYLSLLELKRGNQDQFQTYLKQIPQGSVHYKAARKLIK